MGIFRNKIKYLCRYDDKKRTKLISPRSLTSQKSGAIYKAGGFIVIIELQIVSNFDIILWITLVIYSFISRSPKEEIKVSYLILYEQERS